MTAGLRAQVAVIGGGPAGLTCALLLARAGFDRPLPRDVPLGGHNVRRGLHPRLGTLAREHDPASLAAILWDDERRADPTLPEPMHTEVHGLSDASQIVRHGPLPIQAAGRPVYLATNMSGAATAYDPRVESLPTGPASRHPWR